jgi:hypothetical protein
VEIGVVSGMVAGRCRGCGRRPPRIRASVHPWIRGSAQLPVEQPGKLAAGLSQLCGDDLIAGRRTVRDRHEISGRAAELVAGAAGWQAATR